MVPPERRHPDLRAVAAIIVGLLGIGACAAAPRTVSVPVSRVSNAEMGQDVPDDRVSAVPMAVIRCADPLHQARPGGTDYKGPPVPGCEPPY